ncbi:SGNH/GDSL hydrolase family protein [Eubacteriales bacterium OttesenSCG-928-K08]|nr:SGNH/GDSL hydrolase family protein [Eubacteriales bacterium OttesenSCG-928-K08]
MNIRIYGDSLMKGTVIDERLRYRATMGQNIEAFQSRFGVQIENSSRFGSTVERGQAQLKKDIEAGLSGGYALIEFGGNDCDFRWNEVAAQPEKEHLPRTTLAVFEQIYHAMIAALRQRNVTPIVMTLPPIDAERYLDFIDRAGNDKRQILRWLGDTNMIYRFHELYSHAVEKIAMQTNTLLIDVRERFLGLNNFRELIGLDGIHLNPAGYKLMVETFNSFAAGKLKPIIA